MCDVPGFIGFTIGRGRTEYHYLAPHPTGHATVYRDTPKGLMKRWIHKDNTITIYFKIPYDGK